MVDVREMKQRKFNITTRMEHELRQQGYCDTAKYRYSVGADIVLGEYISRIPIALIGTTGFLDADNWGIMLI